MFFCFSRSCLLLAGGGVILALMGQLSVDLGLSCAHFYISHFYFISCFPFSSCFQCSIWAFFCVQHLHFYSSASASFQSQTHQQLLTPSLLSLGDDPFWEAVNLWYGATGDIEWYDPGQVTTRGGALVITMDSTSTTQAGMTNGGFL